MGNKSLLTSINSYPGYAKDALENVYHGKVYAVGRPNGHIDRFFKTRRGAEGYLKRESKGSYYCEYTNEMVSYGSGMFIEEIPADKILNYKTSKILWYNYLCNNIGQDYMYNSIIKSAEYYQVTPELMEYITTSIDDMKNNRGLTVLEDEQTEEILIAEEVHQAMITEEESQIKVNNNIKIIYNDELNGIEISFSDKPEQEIIEHLKLNKFRWSRAKKIWYAKQNEKTISFANSLQSSSGQTVDNNNASQNLVHSYPEIDIDDIDSYVVDQSLQDREHDSNWIFRKNKKDRTAEIQSLFTKYNNKVLAVLETTNDERTIYYLKKSLQSFKKKYFDNYIKLLSNRANNPSLAVTGRAGVNMRRYNKMQDRYDNLMRNSIDLTNWIDSQIEEAQPNIRWDEEQ